MTRYNDSDREKWDAAPEKSKLCEECKLEPNECKCDKDRAEGKEIEGDYVEE